MGGLETDDNPALGLKLSALSHLHLEFLQPILSTKYSVLYFLPARYSPSSFPASA